MFSNLSHLMNLTPSHLIPIIHPENIVNSKYYDIIQVETLLIENLLIKPFFLYAI